MSDTEQRANAIADRIVRLTGDAPTMNAALEYLTRTLSFVAVKNPDLVVAALDYAEARAAAPTQDPTP